MQMARRREGPAGGGRAASDAHALLIRHLRSPVVLAFAAGIAAKLIRHELEFPAPVLNAISIYLVLSIALQGGVELAARP